MSKAFMEKLQIEQLTVKSLIVELQSILLEKGDLPVVLQDADTGWEFKLKKFNLVADDKVLTVSCNYNDELFDN